MADLYNVSGFSIANSSNTIAELGISQLVWIIIILYLTFVIFLGLVGNLVVLYGSLANGDLKLDPASLMFVHNMCISDSVSVVLFFLPKFTTAIFRRWVLGELVCWVVGFFKSACIVNEFLTVFSMSG
jgi:hypothetical protein